MTTTYYHIAKNKTIRGKKMKVMREKTHHFHRDYQF